MASPAPAQRRQFGCVSRRRKIGHPTQPLLFGVSYTDHNVFGLRSLLKIFQHDISIGHSNEIVVNQLHNGIVDPNFNYERIKQHLWRTCFYVITALGPRETAELTAFVNVLYNQSFEISALDKHINRYLRAANIPRYRSRIPFDFERFQQISTCDGYDEELTKSYRGSEVIPDTPYQFRAFGFTFTQHTTNGMQFLLRVFLDSDASSKDKLHMWRPLLRAEQRLDGATRAEFETLARAYYVNRRSELDSTIRFRKQVEDYLGSLHSRSEEERRAFRFIDFYIYRGYEDKDDDINEIGIIVPLDCPSADYYPSLVCDVCMDSKMEAQYPQTAITASCKHDLTVCLDCLSESIQRGLPDPPKCPLCLAVMEWEDVNKWSSKETFDQYNFSLLRKLLSLDETFHYCLSGSCNSGQFFVSDCDTSEMNCHACGLSTCTKHNVPWHQGQTCEEYDAIDQVLLAANKASEEYIQQKTKGCPKCKVRLEKSYGCDHFTCGHGNCNHQFCWVCLAPWSKIANRRANEGWKAHKKSCTYYKQGLPNAAPNNPVYYVQEGNVGAFPDF